MIMAVLFFSISHIFLNFHDIKFIFSNGSFINTYPLIDINMDRFKIYECLSVSLTLFLECHIQVGTNSQLSVAMDQISTMRIFTRKAQILS